jgi:DNA-binding PadR family transcriptional regulator
MKKTKIAARKGSKGKKLGSLTTADLVVLSLLTERSMHGYELVYYAIQKLAGLKLIQSQKSDSHATDRDRTVFTPTAAGRKELEKGLARPEWAQTRIPQPFTTWLGLSIHLKDKEIGTILGERKKFLESELKKEKESLKYIDALESDRAKVGADIVRLVILQIETELRWLGDLMTRKF